MNATELADTHAAAFTDARPWSADEFKALLIQNGVEIIGEAKSFILTRSVMDEVEILTLATHPDVQRKGWASANLRQLFSLASANGATKLFLEVAADNFAALALYKNVGFAEIGRRRAYYTRECGLKVDALVLEKKLT